MKKSDIAQPPCYFDRYISQVEDMELDDAFTRSLADLDALDLTELDRFSDTAYAADKWTIKDIFQHLIDTEHILAYRALRIARNDPTPLPGFDHEVLAANVSTERRALKDLVDELKLVRQTTRLTFATFNDEAVLRMGVASDTPMSALAFGFTIIGHQNHHFRIIREKNLAD